MCRVQPPGAVYVYGGVMTNMGKMSGLLMAAVLLAGCSQQASAPSAVTVTLPAVTVTALPSPAAAPKAPTSAPPVVPANPVPILAKIKGCVIPDGTTAGLTDIAGDRYATCKLGKDGNGGEVMVRTYPGDPRVLDPKMRSDDSQAFIIGSTFVAIVRAPGGLTSSKMPLAEIAAQVGGTVLPPT